MKLFTASAALVPAAWMMRMEAPRGRVQADVIIFARSKADAIALVVKGGQSERAAESLVKETRLNTRTYPDSVKMLIGAGVIDPEQPGIYGWLNGNMDDAVYRFDLMPMPHVATFRYREMREADATGLKPGLYAEAVQQDEPAAAAPQRITWTMSQYGTSRGTIGGVEIASISQSTRRGDDTHYLRMDLPGGSRSDQSAADMEMAQEMAESYLSAFVAKLGATFVDAK